MKQAKIEKTPTSDEKESKKVKIGANIDVAKRDILVGQALREMQFAYQYKQPRVRDWNKNEDMYYGRKEYITDTIANVQLGLMQIFVHRTLTKIDSPLDFSFTKSEIADERKAKLLNALKDKDRKRGRWDTKDRHGKKQAVIYGRAVFRYSASMDLEKRYCSELDNIDVKEFLIDPDAGGDDVDRATYLGWGGTRVTKTQLEAGMKDGVYYADTTKELIAGYGNIQQLDRQNLDQNNRYQAIAGYFKQIMGREDMWKFYTWITTNQEDGERYYMVLDKSGRCIRCVKWADINKKSDKYPIWTWAAFPDAYEFWTPSPCDYVRELFLAQSKAINQMLDNSDKVNDPQIVVNTDYIKNPVQLKYKKKGSFIELTGNVPVEDAFQDRKVPPINTPIAVYNTLDGVVSDTSGMSAEVKGQSDADRVAVYEGNLEEASGLFKLYANSYRDGYRRFAELYQHGVMGWLKKKEAVEIMGSEGLEVEEISYVEVKPYRQNYDIVIDYSDSANNPVTQKNKEAFLSQFQGTPEINQKALFEVRAQNAGLDTETIKLLMEADYGNSEMVARAEEIFQQLIAGQEVELFRNANNAFRKRLLELSWKYEDRLDDEQNNGIIQYIMALKPIVEKNFAREIATRQELPDPASPEQDVGAALTPGAAVGQPGMNPPTQPLVTL